MSNTNKLVQSGNRLQRQSLLFFQQTRHSGEAFVSEARTASVVFGDEMTRATTKLVDSTGRSAATLGRAFRREAISWRDLTIKTRDTCVQALKTRASDLESRATLARDRLRPGSQAGTPAKAKRAGHKTGRAPIRNYDQLTAKDVVERVRRLSEPQATALLDYEQVRKNRATVIRAAKQRLAAS